MNQHRDIPQQTMNRLLLLGPGEQQAAVQSAQDPEQVLLSLIDLGAQRNLATAEDPTRLARALVELADHFEYVVPRLRARRACARALALAGRFEESIAICTDALRIAAKADEPVESGRLQLALMHPLNELGRSRDAVAAGERARTIFEQAGRLDLAGRADINLGITHARSDHPDAAIACFDRAEVCLHDEDAMLGAIANSRGEALVALNRFREADRSFQDAMGHFRRADQDLNVAIAMGNRADVANRRGELDRALHFFEGARRQLAQEHLKVHRARILAEEAEVKTMLGMTDASLRALEQALPQLDEAGLAMEAARARLSIGRVLLKLGRDAEARTALAAAATELKELGHTSLLARVELLRAAVSVQRNRFDEARSLVERARPLLESRPIDRATADLICADLALDAGEITAASAYVDAARAAVEPADVAPLRAEIEHRQARIRRAQGRYDEAIEACRRSIAQIDRVHGSLQADRFREAFLGDRLDVYEELVGTILDRAGEPRRINDHVAEELFEALELARARSLLDETTRLQDSAIEEAAGELGDTDRTLEARFHEAVAELNALYSRLGDASLSGASGERVSAWRTAVARLEAELADLEDRRSSSHIGAALSTRTVEYGEFQADLDDDVVAIEYFSVGSSLNALVMTSSGCELFELGETSVVAGVVRRFMFQVERALRPGALDGSRAERRVQDIRRESQQLYDLLLRPCEARLEHAARLLIIPSVVTHDVPMHALHDGRQFAVERWIMSTTPSASIAWRLRRRTRDAGTHTDGVLLVGVSDSDAPEIRSEIEGLASILGDRATVLTEADATTSAVRAACGDQSILHFACHARFDPESPMGSGMKLADRWFTLRDVQNLRFAADLVALSGCETGLSRVQPGENLTGLIRACLAAGARNVMVSSWRVDDSSAQWMMQEFHRSLESRTRDADVGGSRVDPAAALRDAQLACLERSPHPARWAPFRIVGEMQ